MRINPPPYTVTPAQQQQPSPGAPELAVALSADPATHDVLISIIPPKEPLSNSEAPVDICCVIDVSGSMDSELKASLEEGKEAEKTGLSTLDVVKHAVKTIIATMQPDDRIAIVTFSTSAKVIVGLTSMTAAGKIRVLKAVQDLHTLDSTNIWEGLKTGMNVLNGLASVPASPNTEPPVSSSRISTLLLLTDGLPNINPPRGIIQMLKSYLDTHPLRFSIQTFGFGYALDSQLLLQIARLGGGAFGFIPDASSLGAIFIHAVANLYSTCADRVELSVEYPAEDKSGAEGELVIPGGQNGTAYSWGAKIEVGAVQYGQTRNFLVRMKDYTQRVGSLSDPVLSVTVAYRPWTHGPEDEPLTCTMSLTREAIASGASSQDRTIISHHSHRFRFIQAVDNISKSAPTPASSSSRLRGFSSSSLTPSLLLTDTSIPEFKKIMSSLQQSPLSTYPPASALAQDISGEVLLAIDSSYVFDRWGKHYLPSLARYHLLQQCGSFRDPGLQVYGAESPLFTKSRDALDQAFDSLPPPEPSVRRRSTPGPGGTAPQRRVAMSAAFASRSGPCFDGTCEIALVGGKRLTLKDLRRGMQVDTPQGGREVVAVLETRMEAGEALLCELPGGLKVTPWHPIKVFSNPGARWVFPVSQVRPEFQACDAVYSLLLEPDVNPDAHGVYIQDVLCVTLGHGITHSRRDSPGEDVRAHEFLGDYERIVRSLATFPTEGESTGVFRVAHVLKDGVSEIICGFVPHENTRSDFLLGMSVQNALVV